MSCWEKRSVQALTAIQDPVRGRRFLCLSLVNVDSYPHWSSWFPSLAFPMRRISFSPKTRLLCRLVSDKDAAFFVFSPRKAIKSIIFNSEITLGGFILSLVSIPQAYLRRTSDVNGSNFSVSRQLCSLGNARSSKPPKYTFKSCSTRLTTLLTLYQSKIRKLKHQSNCNEISSLHLAGNWTHAHLIPLLTSGPRFTNKEKSMENSTFYQRRPYFRVLDNGDNYFDQGLM